MLWSLLLVELCQTQYKTHCNVLNVQCTGSESLLS